MHLNNATAFAILTTLAATNSAHLNASEWQLYSSVKSQAYSESVSAYEYTNEWNESLDDGTLAVHRSQGELGVKKGDFSVASIWERHDIVRPNRDTTEIYHSIENEIPFELNRQYDINVDGYQLALNGIKFAWQHQFASGWQTGIAIKLLQGLEFLDGKAIGSATAIADKDYDFDLALDYAYSSDPILDRPFQSPNSSDTRGFALDLSLAYIWGENHFASIQVDNAFAEMHWKDAGITKANASSNTKEFDSNGFVKFKPVLSGKEATKDYRQDIPVYIDAVYQQPISARYSSSISVYGSEVKLFRELALLRHFENSTLKASWMPKEQAFGLRWQHKYFEIGLVSDDLELKNAHYLELVLAANVPL